MANSVDPDQLASEEANWSGSTLQRQDISGFSRTRVKVLFFCMIVIYLFIVGKHIWSILYVVGLLVILFYCIVHVEQNFSNKGAVLLFFTTKKKNYIMQDKKKLSHIFQGKKKAA